MDGRLLSTRLAPLQVGALFLCWGVPDFPLPPPAPPEVRLPDFLAIGAMKCGTTTLWRDLRTLPEIFLPDKESNALLAADPAAALARQFATAGADRLTGEVCPDYTKPALGDRAAAAARALHADRPAPRLIYVVREPIARLLSHHHFLSTQHGAANPGGMTADLEASLRDFPELVETSRYAARLRPWIDAFGLDSLKVVRFEDYVATRAATVSEIADFLGLSGVSTAGIHEGAVFNAGDTRPVATPGWRKLLRQPIYRRGLRPWLPPVWREKLRSLLLPKPPPRPAPPSRETLRGLAAALTPDVAELSRLAGAPGLLWDLDAAADALSGKAST